MSLIDGAINAGVARVTLNNSERRNVLSGALVRELWSGELVAAFDGGGEVDPKVSAVVVRGSGPTFCGQTVNIISAGRR